MIFAAIQRVRLREKVDTASISTDLTELELQETRARTQPRPRRLAALRGAHVQGDATEVQAPGREGRAFLAHGGGDQSHTKDPKTADFDPPPERENARLLIGDESQMKPPTDAPQISATACDMITAVCYATRSLFYRRTLFPFLAGGHTYSPSVLITACSVFSGGSVESLPTPTGLCPNATCANPPSNGYANAHRSSANS